ncbi:MAG: beta-propeller fold lactonase family protein [Candidatus Acidiferrales bacterium]
MRKSIVWVLTFPLLVLSGLPGCTVFISTNGSTVRSIQITPANPTISVGSRQQFTANVTFGDGITIQVDSISAIWASSNPFVATINDSGLASGLKPGTATITGTFDNVSGSTLLTVSASPQARSVVSASAGKLEVAYSGSRQCFLFVLDSLNDAISVFIINSSTGQEALMTKLSVAPAHAPAWLALDPSGRFLYVGNHGSPDISAFLVDSETGRLVNIAGSPFPTGNFPWSISVSPDGELLSVTHLEPQAASLFRIDSITGALTWEERH